MIASSYRAKGEYTDDTQMALLIAESLLYLYRDDDFTVLCRKEIVSTQRVCDWRH